MLAIMIQAVALSMVASKSLARRRLRLSQAMVRSTTQRRGRSSNPFAASERGKKDQGARRIRRNTGRASADGAVGIEPGGGLALGKGVMDRAQPGLPGPPHMRSKENRAYGDGTVWRSGLKVASPVRMQERRNEAGGQEQDRGIFAQQRTTPESAEENSILPSQGLQ